MGLNLKFPSSIFNTLMYVQGKPTLYAPNYFYLTLGVEYNNSCDKNNHLFGQ